MHKCNGTISFDRNNKSYFMHELLNIKFDVIQPPEHKVMLPKQEKKTTTSKSAKGRTE